MSSSERNISRSGFCLLTASLLFSATGYSQDYESVAARYKNSDAVVTNLTRHLVISNDNGELVANSYYSTEKLFLTDVSRGIYNMDYLFHSDFNELSDLTAVASLPTKDGYRTVPCYNFADVNPSGDNVFYDDSRFAVVSYAGLQKNAVTKTTYAIEHTDLNMIPPFTFQENLPVDKAVFEVTVPKYVNISFVLKGSDTAAIKRTVEEKKYTTTYVFTINGVKAFKSLDNVPSSLYYRTQIIPYITSYKMSESNKKVTMLGNTDDLYKYLYKYVKDRDLKQDTMMERTVAEIVKGDATDRDKARHIYQWVQKNMHYIAFEKGQEGFVPREASMVLNRKYGDCKDMTALLVTMCRTAALDAHYTWIGTREKPYNLAETPLPLVNNHMICALKLNDEWLFLDGTHPYIPFGQNPSGIQGKEAMIALDAKNYKVVSVPVTATEKNTLVDSTTMTFTGRQLAGSLKQCYTGYEAWDLGIMHMYLKGDDWDKAIRSLTERGTDKYHQTRNVVYTGKTPEKNATVEADFTVDDYVLHAGKEYFVNMNLKRTFEDKRIDDTERMVANYYDYKNKVQEVVVLNIPKGYRVAHVPPSAEGSVDGLWKYKISYKADKKQVTLVKEYELSTLEANPKLFASNNKMVDDLKKLYKETVVLTAN